MCPALLKVTLQAAPLLGNIPRFHSKYNLRHELRSKMWIGTPSLGLCAGVKKGGLENSTKKQIPDELLHYSQGQVNWRRKMKKKPSHSRDVAKTRKKWADGVSKITVDSWYEKFSPDERSITMDKIAALERVEVWKKGKGCFGGLDAVPILMIAEPHAGSLEWWVDVIGN